MSAETAWTEALRIANEYHGGHFTLMRFTTNWSFTFGTVDSRRGIERMWGGKTPEEAISKAIAAECFSQAVTTRRPRTRRRQPLSEGERMSEAE